MGVPSGISAEAPARTKVSPGPAKRKNLWNEVENCGEKYTLSMKGSQVKFSPNSVPPYLTSTYRNLSPPPEAGDTPAR
jgi:hypothetical protein